MQILLSCAKDMSPAKDIDAGVIADIDSDITTTPLFMKEAVENASVMAGFSEEELGKMLKVSPKIAAENFERYKDFCRSERRLAPAAFSYTGMAYRHLKAGSWSEDDCIFANEHLWICSFLYGLLRPMDMIWPYRLEGNIRLREGRTMFDYWKPLLTDVLIESVENDGGTLVHLATEEMTHLFDWTKVKESVRIIEPKFYTKTKGRMKVVTVHAKMCRGAMASFIIKNRIGTAGELKDFSYDGYAFAHSNDDEIIFHCDE